jgi:hypothetical protein
MHLAVIKVFLQKNQFANKFSTQNSPTRHSFFVVGAINEYDALFLNLTRSEHAQQINNWTKGKL